jgi:hypothetical protein
MPGGALAGFSLMTMVEGGAGGAEGGGVCAVAQAVIVSSAPAKAGAQLGRGPGLLLSPERIAGIVFTPPPLAAP